MVVNGHCPKCGTKITTTVSTEPKSGVSITVTQEVFKWPNKEWDAVWKGVKDLFKALKV